MINTSIEKRGSRYVISKPDTATKLIRGFMIFVVIVSILFLTITVEYKWDLFNPNAFVYFLSQFLRFDLLPFSEFVTVFSLLGNTLALAFLTTFIGVVLGFLFGLLGSSNITNQRISSIVKAIAGFIRAVPTIIWVLFFISGYGLTATTAIVGMSFHSIAFFIKSFSESFEEIDPGTIETLKATGASKSQIISSAMIPTAFTKLIAWMALRLELNFAVAVIIGPAVGVPGTIGTKMNTYSRGANFPGLGLSIFAIFTVVFLLELFITKYKQKNLI